MILSTISLFTPKTSTRGLMRQQTKPFIVERKPSRKPKSDATKASIWGKLDLTLNQHPQTEREPIKKTAVGVDDRP
ncbi:hypothetical protein [Rhizobium sp. Leaf453]|uniref:hypothetical protein n=1 Tax=Rhizobium sp. Leaf453 TaxID=1736380 RepID=UPI000713C205|nr:hypothetical protein [Rhizobium sp. Leaf453]KQU06129.1 hypothetical protein ASG68_25755 [Rhizobium sp. Leaf453]